MSTNELKQFKREWLQLWKLNFTDEEASRYALMDEAPSLPIQPGQNTYPSMLQESNDNLAAKYEDNAAPKYQNKKLGVPKALANPNTSRNATTNSKGGSLYSKIYFNQNIAI